MSLHLTIMAADKATEERHSAELKAALGDSSVLVARISGSSSGEEQGQIVFVDGTVTHDIGPMLARIDRRGRAVFLITRDGAKAPSALADGSVDDVLVHPFRPLEIQSRLRHYEQILMWDEVKRLNASFSQLIQGLQDDLKLAERLQKSKLPLRFPEVKGFEVHSRYLAGMRSGGDHLDLADAKDGSQLSVVLSDSSSYGLSSAVLSALVHVAVKLSSEEARSSVETVRRVHEELAATLGEKDRLSLFYGIVSRKDFTLRYLNLGSSSAFHARKDGKFSLLPSQGGQITRTSNLPSQQSEGQLKLEPQDRLALISDGFVEAAGGAEAICAILDKQRQNKSVDSLNDLVFQVKSKLESADDMPEQDCTAAIFDVDAKILRLAT